MSESISLLYILSAGFVVVIDKVNAMLAVLLKINGMKFFLVNKSKSLQFGFYIN